MRLFEFDEEFDQDDPLRVATTAALSHAKAEIEDTAYKGKYTLDTLQQELEKYDVRLSKAQMIELAKQEPWKNLISNISGEKVVFKGDPDEHSDNEEPDDTTDTLDKMADRSTKKHSDELK
jgi:hypothetical protein